MSYSDVTMQPFPEEFYIIITWLTCIIIIAFILIIGLYDAYKRH